MDILFLKNEGLCKEIQITGTFYEDRDWLTQKNLSLIKLGIYNDSYVSHFMQRET
jgi:hypothetical protein